MPSKRNRPGCDLDNRMASMVNPTTQNCEVPQRFAGARMQLAYADHASQPNELFDVFRQIRVPRLRG